MIPYCGLAHGVARSCAIGPRQKLSCAGPFVNVLPGATAPAPSDRFENAPSHAAILLRVIRRQQNLSGRGHKCRANLPSHSVRMGIFLRNLDRKSSNRPVAAPFCEKLCVNAAFRDGLVFATQSNVVRLQLGRFRDTRMILAGSGCCRPMVLQDSAAVERTRPSSAPVRGSFKFRLSEQNRRELRLRISVEFRPGNFPDLPFSNRQHFFFLAKDIASQRLGIHTDAGTRHIPRQRQPADDSFVNDSSCCASILAGPQRLGPAGSDNALVPAKLR